jgi:hypothetical protein
MLGLVAASIFALIDRLERILHSWSVPSETDSAQTVGEMRTDSTE